ncbi:uncharacterized protein LOC120279147 isoform X2 [Dioscorea cayenensis subsp. rotundata]|uniref:Uncharacterized protein LOC120279147 isoform X2 n=1 Tax=Dioscorea cayennensis subsp. rotundata TaxID=55577 RepID=A0AB40CR23_DIOCR|nr:uncharacterized protein LOC120279147 isoform X2 [Dioscorea cayenensis subsp. rotundata]
MASQSRVPRPVDDGGGGDGGDPPPPPRRRLRWLSGLISGAGRLISSVLDSPSFSSEDDDDLLSEEDEDSYAQSKNLVDLNQSGKNLEQAMDMNARSLAIDTKDHSKDAIEKLLVQETFSRDECDKLSKIIQTRVVDPPSVEVSRYGMQKERLSRTNSNIVSPPEARWPVDHLTELPETILYSSPRLSPISPRKWLLHSQDLHSTAVMEAKKWLEEKKSSPNSKSDLNSSPCTDVPQYCLGGEIGSPVELAKSYMQSLPPWQSPSWNSKMCIAGQAYKDETLISTTSYLFSSSKDLKRKYQAFESRDTLYEIRRIRQKLINNRSESSNFHKLDFSARLLESLSPFGKGDTDVAASYQISLPATEPADHINLPAKLSTKPPEKDHCIDEACVLNVEAAVDASQPVDAASFDINLDGVEAVNPVLPTHGNSIPVDMPMEPVKYNSGLGDEPKSCEPAVVLCAKQGLEPLQIDSLVKVGVICDSTSLTPMDNEHDGKSVKYSQPTMMPTEETKSDSGSGEREAVQIEDSSLPHLGLAHKESDTTIGTRSTGGNDQIQKGANECTNGNDANCSPTGLVTVQVVEYVGYRHPANSSNGELAALAISDGPFQAKTKGLPVETNAGIGKSRNGTSVRSVKRMLSESKNAKRAKERKTAGNPRRSKGKVKGSSD